MAKKTKLELTWIGKEQRPRLEPRVLVEDPSVSYHAPQRVSENDFFDNRLIFGDNLLALKAMEQEFTGKIKCVFIDPPYNTGSAFEHYDDGIEHSLWLSLMSDRLEILKRLLSDDGSIWITIDDNECHYLKVLADEVFGRVNFIANIVWQSKDTPGNNSGGIAQTHNHILAYRKTPQFRPSLLTRSDRQVATYTNPDGDPRGPWLGTTLTRAEHRDRDYYALKSPTGRDVFPPKGSSWRRPPKKMQELEADNRIWWGQKGDADFPKEKKFITEVKEGVVNQTWWPYEFAGSTRNASAELKGLFGGEKTFDTPKPEKLLQRILEMATSSGDWILDSFAGSGTTGAAAHKMGRKWIMVELGDHCHSHIIPRLRKVIDGHDNGGISTRYSMLWETKISLSTIRDGSEVLEMLTEAELEHEGEFDRFEKRIEDENLRLYGIERQKAGMVGGGFRYFSLAPSLLQRDQFGNWVINKKYNAVLLAQAVCKVEGFTYAPSESVYWQQGHSTERDFIYVTTQTLTRPQIEALSEEVGPSRSLVIYCHAFRVKNLDEFPNLTLKKIPKTVIDKCEWGKDDYSLEIKALQPATPEPDDTPPPPRRKRKRDDSQPSLFAMEGDK